MGLERRRNGYYYYRKQRIGKRVRSIYVGGGLLAELEAEQQAAAAAERAEERAALAALQAHLADPPELAAYLGLVRALTDATLAAAGFRQHQRGEWRRTRDRDQHAS
jgi:hypothetical protein